MIRPGGSYSLRFYKLRMLYINSAIAGLSRNTFWVMMQGGQDEIITRKTAKGHSPHDLFIGAIHPGRSSLTRRKLRI